MKKRILALLLAALLALASGTALADGTWACPACGTKNAGNFCAECGAAKPAQGWVCPACGTENTGNFCTECGAARPAESWICPACGTENTGNFCTECGAARPDGPAPAEYTPSAIDAALDSAFEAGRVGFAPAELPLPDFDTCELAVPEEFWQLMQTAPMDDGTLRTLLAAGTWTPVSISPDGTRMAAYLETAGITVPVVVSPDRVALICPTTRRGVPDTYEAMAKTYQRMYLVKNDSSPLNMGREGMLWSPDGRYFCSIDVKNAVLMMRFLFCNPIIVDTETGEMFLLDTYDTLPANEGAGCILTGCFSRDGRSFYVLYYGRGYDTRCMPLRYDLETGEKEVWGTGTEELPYPCPQLTELADGRLLAFFYDGSGKSPMYMGVMSPEEGLQRVDVPVLSMIWQNRSAAYSAVSGRLLTRGSYLYASQVGQIDALQCLCPDESLEDGLDVIWAVSAETRALDRWDLKTLASLTNNDNVDTLRALTAKYLPIADAALSPDGRYAAVLTGTVEEPFLLIVRLEDMAALTAEGIALSDTAMFRPGQGSAIYWNETGLLVRDEGDITLWAIAG